MVDFFPMLDRITHHSSLVLPIPRSVRFCEFGLATTLPNRSLQAGSLVLTCSALRRPPGPSRVSAASLPCPLGAGIVVRNAGASIWLCLAESKFTKPSCARYNFPESIEKLKETLFWILKKIFEVPAGYFLKISVFQNAALQGCFSQTFVRPIALMVVNLWKRSQGIPQQSDVIDQARLDRTEAFLKEFSEVRTLRTPDGIDLAWRLYRPEKFQRWIEASGGIRQGEWIVPRNLESWERLKRLSEFKCFEQRGQSFRVPAPVRGAQNQVVLHCHSFGRLMAMDKPYIGQHLAAGFNFAQFDWRDEISIKGYFQDAETCYQELLRQGFRGSQIKVMASCRGTFPAVYLKARHHAEGVDCVLIHPPPSLSQVIAMNTPPANWIGLIGIGAIEKEGEHFDSIQRLQSLAPGTGRLCLIMSERDKMIPQDTAQQFANAYGNAGPFHVIWEPKDEMVSDPHFEDPLRLPAVFQQYAAFLG